MLKLGERIAVKGRTLTVTPTAFESLPRVRAFLIEVAQSSETVTYAELHGQLDLPYAVNGMGRLLDSVSEDCIRRGEPSLAALVVNAQVRWDMTFLGTPWRSVHLSTRIRSGPDRRSRTRTRR